MHNGTWTKGNAKREGKWEWVWHSNGFRINLNKSVSLDGEMRKSFFLLGAQTPEWGLWKLER